MSLEPTTSHLRLEMIVQHHEDTGKREYIQIKPNSCLSDLLDSVEYRMSLLVEKTQINDSEMPILKDYTVVLL